MIVAHLMMGRTLTVHAYISQGVRNKGLGNDQTGVFM